ncbi:MAG: FAD-binding oxidoreductase [Actinomycetota bacterium]|nr:FAD-binding oxidoreductase [Actinomycetota bacterium]
MTGVRRETANARTLLLDVPDWPGNAAGQHLDLRLTAPDGYQAARSYSIASEGPGTLVEITVDEIPTGEVSPYLVRDVGLGERLELRGPLGSWFVWRPDQEEPVQLIGGGSGCVPLFAMVRAHARAAHPAPFRLLYSVRDPGSVFYARDLVGLSMLEGLEVDFVYTRATPPLSSTPPGRLTSSRLVGSVFPPQSAATVYVCGPTRFVETVADWLVQAGHPPSRIRTERFGGA